MAVLILASTKRHLHTVRLTDASPQTMTLATNTTSTTVAPPQQQQPPLNAPVLDTYHAQLTQHLDAYFAQTKLLTVLQSYTRSLAQRYATSRLVPRNPYTELLAHVRQAEISADLLLDTATVKDTQELLLFRPPDDRSVPVNIEIVTFKTAPAPTLCVWGPRDALQRVRYDAIWQRQVEAVYDLLSVWLKDSEGVDEGCSVQTIGAMVGPCVLLSYELHTFPTIEIERHVVVHGEQLEHAMNVFARHQIRTLFEATKKGLVTAAGVPVQAVGPCCVAIKHPSSDRDQDSSWTFDRISLNRQAFISAVKLAVVAGGSFVIDVVLLFKSTDVASQEQLVRCQAAFVLHYQYATASATTQPLKAKAPGMDSSPNRSFVSCSRLLQSGVCFTSAGAFDLACRFHGESKRQLVPVAVPDTEERSRSPLHELITCIDVKAADEQKRLGVLGRSEALSLARLVALLDNILSMLQTVDLGDADAVDFATRVLDPSIGRYNQLVSELIQDAAIGRGSSVLRGLSELLSDLCRLPDGSSAVDKLEALYNGLECSRDTIAWLAQGVGRDAIALAKPSSPGPETMVDLRPDITRAIEQRWYPLAIVAESVFTQYLVATQLDTAMERAVVNTVVPGLPPNPFIALCGHLRVSACRFYAESKYGTAPDSPQNNLTPVDAVGLAAVDNGSIMGPNVGLLQTVDVPRLQRQHADLSKRQVYRPAPYHPSKASYSARITSCLILEDPIFTMAKIPPEDVLYQHVEVIEHIVIEGKEVSQALWFFADAVRRDASRLLQSLQQTELSLLDPEGQALTPVELDDIEMFEQLMVEATPKRYVVQATLPPVVRGDADMGQPLIQVVTKSYVFYHVSTEPGDQPSTNVSESLRAKLRHFGVWMDKDAAKATMKIINTIKTESSEMETKSIFQEQPSRPKDPFLQSHLHRLTSMTEGSDSILAPPFTLHVHLHDLECVLHWLIQRLSSVRNESTTNASDEAFIQVIPTILKTVAKALVYHAVPLAEALGYMDSKVLESAAKALGSQSSFDDAPDGLLVRRLWIALRLIRAAAFIDAH